MKNRKLLLAILPLFTLASCGKIQSREAVGEIQDQSIKNIFEKLTSVTKTYGEYQYKTEFYLGDPESYSWVENTVEKLDRKNNIGFQSHETIETYEYQSGYQASKVGFQHNYYSFEENDEYPDDVNLYVNYESTSNADDPNETVCGRLAISEFKKEDMVDKNIILMNYTMGSMYEYIEDIKSVSFLTIDKDYVAHYEWCDVGNYIEVYEDDNNCISGYCASSYDIYFDRLGKKGDFILSKTVETSKYYYFENLDGTLKNEPVLYEKEETITEFGYEDVTLEVENYKETLDGPSPLVGFYEDEYSLDQLVDAAPFQREITEIYKDIHNDTSNIRVYNVFLEFSEGYVFTFLVEFDETFEVLGSDYYHFDSEKFAKVEGSPNAIKCLQDGIYSITAITDASTDKLLEVNLECIEFFLY